VEAVRRKMRRVLQGRRVVRAVVAPDEIVLSGVDPDVVRQRLEGQQVTDVGRKGKFWWLELGDRPWVFGHLGMSGWVHELGGASPKLHFMGEKSPFDEEGNPRFMKLLLETEDGGRIAFTDARRLGRLWLAEGPEADKQVQRLGHDAFDELPEANRLHEALRRRKAPIKAVLLDQGLFAGVGNYLADEVLYHSRIAPNRLSASLSPDEVARLREAIRAVIEHAVSVDADYQRFPESWLFHHRWGGNRGSSFIDGKEIVRETIGGRTTAWVPELQR